MVWSAVEICITLEEKKRGSWELTSLPTSC